MIANLLGTQPPTGAMDWCVQFAEVFAPMHVVAYSGSGPNAETELAGGPAPGGFDVVLANPPYVRADAQFKHLRHDEVARQKAIGDWKKYRGALVKSGAFTTLYEKWDLYLPFLERAHQLLRTNGRMVIIISDAYNTAKYAARSHRFFLERASVERVDFCSDIDLFDAGVNNTIVRFAKLVAPANHTPVRARRLGGSRFDFDHNVELLHTALQREFGAALFRRDGSRAQRVPDGAVTLDQVCYISVGMVINAHEGAHAGEFTAGDLTSTAKDSSHPKRFIFGKDVIKWGTRPPRYLEWGTDRAPAHFRRQTFAELYSGGGRLFALRICGGAPVVTFDARELMTNHTVVVFAMWHSLAGVRNKSIKKTARYRDERRTGEPPEQADRNAREALSRQYDLQYLLGIMNSAFARDWLAERRRSKTDIYPDDWKILPIAPATDKQQAAIAALVQKCLDAKGAGCEVWEQEINERVAGLYGL